MHHQIPFFLALHLSVQRFQRVKFFENVGNIWNCLRNRPTSTKYDYLRSFASVDSPLLFLAVDHGELCALIFQNQGSFPRALISLKRSQ